MPRIPRRTKGSDQAPAPEDQRTAPTTQQISSGDPLGPRVAAPTGAATSGDPLGQTASPPTPATTAQPAGEPPAGDHSVAPAITPATTAAPSEADPAPGDASSARDGNDEAAASTAVSASGAPPSSGTTSAPDANGPSSTEQPTVAADPTSVLPSSGDPLVGPARATAETGDVRADEPEQAPADARPRFRQRTRMRRRLRYLRRLRELAFRDLGGLVFDLHRFGRDRNDLVTAKLEALATIDRELRTLQDGLQERRDFTDLREAGIAACPRCGTLHDTDANFCPGCGTSLRSAIVRDASPVTVTAADETQPTS